MLLCCNEGQEQLPGQALDQRQVERLHRASADEWAYARPIPEKPQRRAALDPGHLCTITGDTPHSSATHLPPPSPTYPDTTASRSRPAAHSYPRRAEGSASLEQRSMLPADGIDWSDSVAREGRFAVAKLPSRRYIVIVNDWRRSDPAASRLKRSVSSGDATSKCTRRPVKRRTALHGLHAWQGSTA